MKIYNKKKRAGSRVSYFSFLRWKEKKSSTFLLHLQFLRAYQASSREVKMKLRQFHSRFNWISECLKLIDDESDCNETRSSQLIIPKQGGAKKDLERHTMTSLKNCKTAINSLSLRVLHRRVLCCSRHSRPPRTIRMQLWFAHGTERRARASDVDDETKQQKIQLISQETVVEPYLWPFMTSTSDWKFHNSQTDSTTSDSKKNRTEIEHLPSVELLLQPKYTWRHLRVLMATLFSSAPSSNSWHAQVAAHCCHVLGFLSFPLVIGLKPFKHSFCALQSRILIASDIGF